MLYRSPTPDGRNFAKDPCVVRLHGQAFLYYTMPLFENGEHTAYQIGIAKSDDLENWIYCGAIRAEQETEGRGICAPGAIVLNDKIHLFYQSYGQFPKDYICHAVSSDGIVFSRDTTNPVIRPVGDWNIGRAIDADVVAFNGRLYLYWATRDPKAEVQFLGVSSAELDSDFSYNAWRQDCDRSILKPELPWEQVCIEAPAAVAFNGHVYLFYAGAYNCSPQQIGCAISEDGVHFTRILQSPLLSNGSNGAWNSSESGHPYVFLDDDGKMHLFYQGSPDNGKNWYLSRADISFSDGIPCLHPTMK